MNRSHASYVELHARSAFSFLRGASNPEDLARGAARAGLPAMALCDRDGVYGAPRFYASAREQGVRPIIGSELTLEDGSVLPVLVESREGYRNLCRMITRAQLRAPKGESRISWREVEEFSEGLVALTGDEEGPVRRGWSAGGKQGAEKAGDELCRIFGPDRLFVELQRHLRRGEKEANRMLVHLAGAKGLPLLATNGVCYATPPGRAVLDVFTCLRHKTHLDNAGLLLSSNGERHLKTAGAMEALFADLPEAVANSGRLAERLQFSLKNLGYEFPVYPVPAGHSMESFLREATWAGARQRYGGSLSPRVKAQIEHELALIGKLGFSGYFLIVWDIVNFCREQDIMVQGRGSAANSAVCYSLGITAVDPVGGKLLFERFLSEGRKSWPDIDLDLPSGDRRERVIQEVYQRYGQHGAAMTANVITYKGRSAVREIGKVLNFPEETIDRFSRLFAHGDYPHTLDLKAQMAQAGIPAGHPRAPAMAALYQAVYGLPRHLGQHSGGMIICQGKLDTIVPLENASMPGRVVAQWDKEDCDAMGIIKVDLLGLGMMSVLQDTLTICRERKREVDLAQIPKDDPKTFAMMQAADTVGVFQIESRAQMATLPRMKPKNFYDVVIEVALIRPGPIQGKMVHPYLARRSGTQPVDYMHPKLEPVLERTLGVPLFQEQVLKMAMVMAEFSGSEAEELRRAMSFHRSRERMERVMRQLREAMAARGVSAKSIDEITTSISSFALYGFPESHAISFALISYASAWLKTHRAAEFYVALLNNQPMGFYSSATLIQDARRHGLRVKPVDVALSSWDCAVESDEVFRLGLRVVRGMREEPVLQMMAARAEAPFSSMNDFRRRTIFNQTERRTLANIGALNALAEHRREALWQIEQQVAEDDLFYGQEQGEPSLSPLEIMTHVERLRADYRGMGLTTGSHPMRRLRPRLPGVCRAADLAHGRDGQRLTVAGSVICRQRPGTAKGFVFISLEDETGIANAVVTPAMFEKNRLVISQEPFLTIRGVLQNQEGVIHVKAEKIEPLYEPEMPTAASHDFH